MYKQKQKQKAIPGTLRTKLDKTEWSNSKLKGMLIGKADQGLEGEREIEPRLERDRT